MNTALINTNTFHNMLEVSYPEIDKTVIVQLNPLQKQQQQ